MCKEFVCLVYNLLMKNVWVEVLTILNFSSNVKKYKEILEILKRKTQMNFMVTITYDLDNSI